LPNVAGAIVLALLAGVSIVVQQALNANLRAALHSTVWSAATSYAVGIIGMALFALAVRAPLPALGVAGAIPWWAWLGGLFGTIYVALSTLLVSQLGAASFVALLVTGQMIASITFDHFGWIGLTQRPIDLPRLIGVVLLIRR
jgi:bacterial/archaeal transporter family-2 protein